MVARLLQELPALAVVPALLVDKAHVLDGYYIPARYPNGHHAGAPLEHYGALQSREAISYAREILEFARTEMARRADR